MAKHRIHLRFAVLSALVAGLYPMGVRGAADTKTQETKYFKEDGWYKVWYAEDKNWTSASTKERQHYCYAHSDSTADDIKTAFGINNRYFAIAAYPKVTDEATFALNPNDDDDTKPISELFKSVSVDPIQDTSAIGNQDVVLPGGTKVSFGTLTSKAKPPATQVIKDPSKQDVNTPTTKVITVETKLPENPIQQGGGSPIPKREGTPVLPSSNNDNNVKKPSDRGGHFLQSGGGVALLACVGIGMIIWFLYGENRPKPKPSQA